MGDYADDAVDRDLNSMFDYDYYDEYENDEPYGFWGFLNRGIRRRYRRPTNHEIFAEHAAQAMEEF